MKRIAIGLLISAILVFSASPVVADDWSPSRELGEGWVPFAYAVVTWDGISEYTDQYVYYPDGTLWYEYRLPMTNYEFRCKGNTLQFDELYINGIVHPQTPHAVLLDNDGDGVYTGTITARYDWSGMRLKDIIDYTVTVSEDCTVTDFTYTQYFYVHKGDQSSE
ncbi:MAG: hypothetical protein J7L43_00715 [Candidatus Aenigmarchaeota archaeon]|nr:hypothetical protein [Candidatus Aenigmarchaeota archaeon]